MNTQKKEYMEDGQGRLVPINKVKDIDKLEDQLVNKLIKSAEILRNEISGFKDNSFDDVNAFIAILSEQYNAKKGGKKGSILLTSYDQKLKVSVTVADFIQFGAQLQTAKNLIDECIHLWNESSDENIAALINHAFRVDRNNRVNSQAILGLRRLNIQDEKWLRAMDAITDSIKITHSKSYIRFYKRPDSESDWQAVSLDISKL